MKLLETFNTGYHVNIRPWISKAKTTTISHIQHLLDDERQRDPNWFISKRGTRIRQLVSEIFTLELKEVSDDAWTETDFEGYAHSDLISQSINEITSVIEPFYRKMRIELISYRLQQSKREYNNDPTTREELRSNH